MKLLVVAIVLAAVFVRLGIWQLDRLGERRARNARVAARLALPPLDVADPGLLGLPADSMRHRRIVARGVYDFGREQVWRGRSFEGTPGVALVTPLRLADGSAVLVDRGWVPSPDASRVDRSRYREADTVAVVGIGAIPPRGRGDVDLGVLADSVPYPLLSFVIPLEAPPPPPPPPDSRGAGRVPSWETDRTLPTPCSGSASP